MTQQKEHEIAEQIQSIAALTEEEVALEGREALNSFLDQAPVFLANRVRDLDRDAPALIARLSEEAGKARSEYGRIFLLKTCGVLAGAQYGLSADLREKYKPAFLDTLSKAGLNDPSPNVRKTVVKILRSHFTSDDAQTVTPLAGMVADSDPEVRNAAAQSLAGRMERHMMTTRENLWDNGLRSVFEQRAKVRQIGAANTAAIASEITQFMARVQSQLPPNPQ